MDFMTLAVELNWIGKLIYNNLYNWVLGWGNEYTLIGAFGITVILFTLFLKLIVSPLDVWQKVLSRKNAHKMEIMKPELDKLTKQCGEDKNLLMQKQRALYKKYKYSTFSACLPSIVSLVIFFIVFSGFRSAVSYHNEQVYLQVAEAWNNAYDASIASQTEVAPDEVDTAAATLLADQSAIDKYDGLQEKFLLTKNIFMPDAPWKRPVPDTATYSGTGMGSLGISVDATEYNRVMGAVIDKYNYTDEGKKVANGYLILPIVAFILSVISTKLIKPGDQPQMAGQTEEQLKAQKSQQKMMTYFMPVMMGVFALFYSSAFTIYMVVGSIFTTLFNLAFNIVAKQIDARKRDERLSTTIKD